MKPLKRKISITLDEDIIAKIKSISEMDDRSFSQYVNLVLREYLQLSAQDVIFPSEMLPEVKFS